MIIPTCLLASFVLAVRGDEPEGKSLVIGGGVKVDAIPELRGNGKADDKPAGKAGKAGRGGGGGRARERVETSIVWTQDKEPSHKSKDGAKNVAFRDLVIEETAKRMFRRFMEIIKHPRKYGRQIIRDPMFLRQGIDMNKKSSMFDIHVEANHMLIRGFKDLNITYLRLRDIIVHLRLGADMSIEGQYKLDGKVLNFMPVSGEGRFQISLLGCAISAVSFIQLRPGAAGGGDDVVIKELETRINYDEVKFDFENIMGGGAVGNAVNMVINTMGEAIIDTQKIKIYEMLKKTFKKHLSRVM